MECLGATPLERLCGYIINLFPVPLLYSAELWAWLREYCCGAIIPLSVSFSLSPPLSFSLYPLPCLCHSTSFSEDRLRKGARARRGEGEMIRSIFLSGNRLPLSLPLSVSLLLLLPVFCIAGLSDHIIGASWPISRASQISSHTQHITECVTSSTCSSHIMEGVIEIKKVRVVVEKEEDSGMFLNVMTKSL